MKRYTLYALQLNLDGITRNQSRKQKEKKMIHEMDFSVSFPEQA